MASEVEIPWFDRSQAPRPAPPPVDPKRSRDELLRRYFPYLGIGLLLLLAWTLKGPAPRAASPRPAREAERLIGVMPIVAIPKGSLLRPELLRPIRLAPSALTKLQKLRLLSPDDLPKIGTGLRAGRDLPPERPVFWTDLRLLREAGTAPRLKIHYGSGSTP